MNTVRPMRMDFTDPAEGAEYFWWRHVEIEKQVQPALLLGHDIPWPEWVNAGDWAQQPLLIRRIFDIRIVIVLAYRDRPGSLRRLVDGILGANLRPVVVSPVLDIMPRIMAKWQWQMQIGPVGEEWRPQEGKPYG